MIDVETFEEELNVLNKSYEHGSFEYGNTNILFRSVVESHFHNVQRIDKHGIYIIRQKSTRRVLFIGKSGIINKQGNFKDQDIPRRLKNVKNENISANEWFKNLVSDMGPLIIEYIFLRETPKSPTLVASLLLQAHFNEHNSLPCRNNSF